MSSDRADHGGQADDLFGRWLAHREQQGEGAGVATPAPVATQEGRPDPVESPDAALRRALLSVPEPEPAPVVRELDRVNTGFEPVVMPSMRQEPGPDVARRSRRRRGPQQTPTPPLEPSEPAAVEAPVIAAPVVAPEPVVALAPPARSRPAPVNLRTVEADAARAVIATRTARAAAADQDHQRTQARRPATPPVEPSVAAVHHFKPRRGTRRLATLIMLLGMAASAGLVYAALQEPTQVTIGIAATVSIATGAVWATRAGTSNTVLTVRQGQLEVLRQGARFVFDLTSRYTPVEVVGSPGERHWKVLFLRRSMAPFVVDSSVVDPQEFMRVLRFYRPEL